MSLKKVVAQIGNLTGDAISIYRNAEDDSPAELVWANNAFQALTGYSFEDLKNKPPTFIHGGMIPPAERIAIGKNVFSGKGYRGELQCVRPDGEAYWADVSITPADMSDAYYVVHVYRNIEELRRREARAEKALKEREALSAMAEASRQRLSNAINTLPEAIAIFDKDYVLVSCNTAFRHIWSENPGAIGPGMTIEEVYQTGDDKGWLPNEFADWRDMARMMRSDWSEEDPTREFTLHNGTHVLSSKTVVPNGDIVVRRLDISDIKRQAKALERANAELLSVQREIEHKALHDALTGLGNRRLLTDKLNAMLDGRADGKEVAVLHVDLDRFKQINDTMGHATGDFVITHVADVLRSEAPEHSAVARMGGDEFILCFPVQVEDDLPGKVAERLVRILSQPVEHKGRSCRFGASVGVAVSPEGGDTSEELIVNADIALYDAKRAGRSQSKLFSPALNSRMQKQKQTADAIHEGLERNEFLPYFQPQFDAQTLDLIGVEALVRWQHPMEGVVAPDRFLSVAEELNVLDQLDRRVFSAAVKACGALCAEGINIPKLSVNASAPRLNNPQTLIDVRMAHGYPGRIALEILESVLVEEQSDGFADNLRELRAMGIETEIDDFGSGHTSILGLAQIQPDRLKIDQRLIIGLDKSEQALRLLTAVIEIGVAMDIPTTAEGVETADQLQILRELGCDAVQGYLLARPMPAERLKSFLQDETWRDGIAPWKAVRRRMAR